MLHGANSEVSSDEEVEDGEELNSPKRSCWKYCLRDETNYLSWALQGPKELVLGLYTINLLTSLKQDCSK